MNARKLQLPWRLATVSHWMPIPRRMGIIGKPHYAGAKLAVLDAFAHTDSETDPETEAVCALFACNRDREVFNYLRNRAQSPLQVPFYFLDLVRRGNTEPSAGPLKLSKPTAEQVDLAYRAILQRPPEEFSIVSDHVEKCSNLDQLLELLLSSQEAIERMPRLYARAFPFARRLWHIHIPKTAGSSFFDAAEESGWGFVNTNTLSGAVGHLSRVADGVRLSSDAAGKTIITGHWQYSMNFDCFDPFDQVLVFVRHPLDQCVSEFNYGVDVVNRRPNVHQTDPQLMLERGLDPQSFRRSFEQGFFGSNLQCGYLAEDATCPTALKNMATCRAELLPTAAASDAISRFFPNAGQRRVNVSNKHITPDDIEGSLREEILLRNSQDFMLNEIAQRRYEASQELSHQDSLKSQRLRPA